MSADLLSFRDLTVEYPSPDGGWRAVLRGVSLDVRRGERIALVGESGSGKSVAALAALGMVAPPGRQAGGRVAVAGIDLATATPEQLRRLRGGDIGLVFQEPSGAFNPVLSVGRQIAETARTHRRLTRAQAAQAARSLLARTALEAPEEIYRAYPHQLSGGQLQRAMIALALAGEPALLIADEPTTALDLSTQARILDLLRDVTREGRGLVLISHDLAVVSSLVDRIVVLFAGEVVEAGSAAALVAGPVHPYTRRLLEAAQAGGIHTGAAVVAGPGPPVPTAGCRFAHRCPLVEPSCRREHPGLEPVGHGHAVRCPVARKAGGDSPPSGEAAHG